MKRDSLAEQNSICVIIPGGPSELRDLHIYSAFRKSQDYVFGIRKDLLDEEDNPMLIHGLNDLNNRKIILPSPQILSPDPELLERQFEGYRKS